MKLLKERYDTIFENLISHDIRNQQNKRGYTFCRRRVYLQDSLDHGNWKKIGRDCRHFSNAGMKNRSEKCIIFTYLIYIFNTLLLNDLAFFYKIILHYFCSFLNTQRCFLDNSIKKYPCNRKSEKKVRGHRNSSIFFFPIQ